ncbi:MAG: amidohydrolase family protein [Planctomycetes bacterium]|nr:amidohydrolase family protein [Planctomycetota bacterium]
MTDWQTFSLNPADYGLPSRDALRQLRIWDGHYHGFLGSDPLAQHAETMHYVERMGIERVFALEIGGSLEKPFAPTGIEAQQREILERDGHRVSGLVCVDPGEPEQSVEKMVNWIRQGPCVGIKYAGHGRHEFRVSHPKNDAIIRLAADLQAIIYVHTWLKVGGSPRTPGGSNLSGEATPMDLVTLAKRFPDVPFICGHTGGDWELGIRAIQSQPNIFLEFAGSDPHSGAVDLAVRELGAERIVWGGHGPSRSYATELSKVLDADLTHEQRLQILGGNLRRIAGPIFKKKGYKV